MKFIETKLQGSYIIEPELLEDERGFFARSFCRNEFETQGLITDFVQCNISFNRFKGTLRGMHYQDTPFPETKIIRCTQGSIYDVIVDLRAESPTYCQWLAVELNAENRKMLYVPSGFAHGFQTLLNNTEVFYQISEFYHPEFAKGVRWDDPVFRVRWPLYVSSISERDKCFKNFVNK